jgi:hypothetical protein
MECRAAESLVSELNQIERAGFALANRNRRQETQPVDWAEAGEAISGRSKSGGFAGQAQLEQSRPRKDQAVVVLDPGLSSAPANIRRPCSVFNNWSKVDSFSDRSLF